METVRGTLDFGIRPEDMANNKYWETNKAARWRLNKRCPVCNEPISDVSKTCHSCAMELRMERNWVRRSMRLLTLDEMRQRFRERIEKEREDNFV